MMIDCRRAGIAGRGKRSNTRSARGGGFHDYRRVALEFGERALPLIHPSERVYPVMGGSEWVSRATGDGPLVKNVFGTAFTIADSVFITAAHVYQAVEAETYKSIGYVEDGSNVWRGAMLDDAEVFPDIDVAIMKTSKAPKRTIAGWTGATTLPLSTDVTCTGYPFADMANLLVNARVFKGHIVGTIDEFDRLPGRPPVYELSFACPRGLSGAPILVPDRGSVIAAMVIGNTATEMIVHEEREYDADANGEKVVIKIESLRLGIALQIEALKPVRSRLLGGSLYDHVANIS